MSNKRYAWIERRRIYRKAMEKLGKKMNGGDSYEDFMGECVSNLMSDVDTMDENTAMDTCQLLWDEEGDIGWSNGY